MRGEYCSPDNGRRSPLRITRSAERKGVQRYQLECRADEQPGRGIADEPSGNCRRDQRPLDHRLRKAHDVETEQAAEKRDRKQIDPHQPATPASRSSSGIGRAPGTSCAEIDTPCVAISRKAASSSLFKNT